ncbi:hypothetical protein SAMN02949497_2035 [Methylomagnum ishizawai]|uniref:Type VI secretion system protein ImpA n=1 Tax=Methylomagnum ishizawai TaxID=1760988 RepID=A0A1Y6D1H8_9GAMM|nr:type VI secretion system protein IglI family protein [Methylomagnum ishizawai]SMF94703.1 hypothetical protein SAMN02949497_2035 [Methylomagnum ishizawai]
MRIDLLLGELPVTEHPGLDSGDPRFDEIAGLVQNGDHAAAAQASEALLAEGIYDIRLICYFLYGHWLEQGVASWGEVLEALGNTVLNQWEAIGPVEKREKKVELSLNWLFKQVLKTLQYEEGKQSPTWNRWLSDTSSEELDPVLDAVQAFGPGIGERLGDGAGTVLDVSSKIREWLRNFQRLVYREPEPEPEPVEEIPEAEEPEPEPERRAAPKPALGLEGELSYPMALLLRKLAAFERLVAEEKFPRAALVADDINQTLANFDPKLYFPQIFATFARLQALNIGELLNYADQRDSPEWQAMQEWFKVDIDSFTDE